MKLIGASAFLIKGLDGIKERMRVSLECDERAQWIDSQFFHAIPFLWSAPVVFGGSLTVWIRSTTGSVCAAKNRNLFEVMEDDCRLRPMTHCRIFSG